MILPANVRYIVELLSDTGYPVFSANGESGRGFKDIQDAHEWADSFGGGLGYRIVRRTDEVAGTFPRTKK